MSSFLEEKRVTLQLRYRVRKPDQTDTIGRLPKIYSAVSRIFSYMASSTRDNGPNHEDEIRMWREGDGWVITDVETGVTTQGETRQEALEMLDEAVALHKGEIGESIETPEEEHEVLRDLGIDPEEVEAGREENDELPDFMQ